MSTVALGLTLRFCARGTSVRPGDDGEKPQSRRKVRSIHFELARKEQPRNFLAYDATNCNKK